MMHCFMIFILLGKKKIFLSISNDKSKDLGKYNLKYRNFELKNAFFENIRITFQILNLTA